jgi:predicted nucleotidyltransferase component of viral defense system
VIQKQDILDRAAEWHLRAEVVEKDYVLGWLLAGLAHTPMSELWVFKGGTCIKKCYFETYRFSEDLDFSLRPDAPYTPEALTQQLRELASRVSELSGLEFPLDLIEVKPRRNQQGQATYEGRLAYRGPLSFPGNPKIRFDFTQHEPVLDDPAERMVLHPYPDQLPAETTVRTYSFNELLAEKTRALLERSRPRDLYETHSAPQWSLARHGVHDPRSRIRALM